MLNRINLTKKIYISHAIFIFFIVYYLLATIMPVVSRIIDVRIYLLIIILLYLKIFTNSYKKLDKYILYILSFLGVFIIECFSVINKGESLIYFFYDELLLLFPSILFIYLLSLNNYKLNHILVKTILFAFIITSFTSFIGLRNDPSAARWLATVKDSNDAYFVSLNLKNIGGYSTVYSCVLIFPMIISMFKYKYIKLPYFIIIYLLFSLFLIYAQYTTALLLFFSSSVLIFLPKKLPTKKLLLIIFGSIIFLLIVRPFLGDLFYYFSSISNSIGVSKRLYVVGDLIKGIDNNSQANTRIPLITYDIQLFLKYPLFGSLFNASGENSGHSFILDILAKSGVFGAFSLFFMYRQIYKSFYSSLNKSPFFGYVIISYILVMITSIVNTGSWIFVLSFVIPLFAVHLNSYINFQLIQPHTIKG